MTSNAQELANGASGLLRELTALLKHRSPHLLETWPLDHYIACLNKYPEVAGLRFVSSDVQKICKSVGDIVGDAGLELYHRALLLSLMLEALSRLPSGDLPEDIKSRFVDDFGRIAQDIEVTIDQPNSYVYSCSSFCKDLAICSLRLIPVGYVKVHANRLPRLMFLTGGLGGTIRAARFALIQQRGLGPFYEAHMHSKDRRAMRDFSPRGWIQTYLRIAELLRRNPHIKGMFGMSWLNDPAVFEISPHLAYLTTVMTDNGGRLFCLGSCDERGVRDATINSGTRRRLYEEGKYVPMNYMVVWARDKLIAWADSKPEVDTLRSRTEASPTAEAGTGVTR